MAPGTSPFAEVVLQLKAVIHRLSCEPQIQGDPYSLWMKECFSEKGARGEPLFRRLLPGQEEEICLYIKEVHGVKMKPLFKEVVSLR